jgi:uroporphyrinogen-III synthase
LAAELSGRAILVTRPRAQAAGLARLIEQAGGQAHLFPAVEIEEVPPAAALGRLEDFDLAIFVSPTAVAKVMPHVRKLPRVAAVGAGTRKQLEKHGVTDVIAPTSGADSEALLAVPGLQEMKGKKVAILRGDGGRALLGETLAARGARVEHVTCYRRLRPQAPARAWRAGELAAVTVSSGQGLANLFEVLDAALLRATPLFVPHARIAEQARTLHAREVVLAGHSDEEMRDALVAYFRVHG